MSIRLTCLECGHVWCSEFDDDDCPKCNPPINYRDNLEKLISITEELIFILENDHEYNFEAIKDYTKKLKKELGVVV